MPGHTDTFLLARSRSLIPVKCPGVGTSLKSMDVTGDDDHVRLENALTLEKFVSCQSRQNPELLQRNAIKVSVHVVAQRNIFTAMRPQNRYTVEHSRAFAD